MKVFWWQGGLHAEPETKEEQKALVLLLDSMKLTSMANTEDSAVCTGVLSDHGAKVGVANFKL
jgi:hypothetical protein